MSEYQRKRSDEMRVVHLFSGKSHFFRVINPQGHGHEVRLNISCDCLHASNKGVSNNSICSHVLAVFRDVYVKSKIIIDNQTKEESVLFRRRSCLNLIRQSNRNVNEIKTGSNESLEHQNKKIEICKALELLGKDFVTEAIFSDNSGRADIICLDDFTIYEIVKSEKEESLIAKKNKYPEGLIIKIIRC